LFEETELVNTY